MIFSNLLIVFYHAVRLLALYAFKYYLRVERVFDRIICRTWQWIKSFWTKPEEIKVVETAKVKKKVTFFEEEPDRNMLKLQLDS